MHKFFEAQYEELDEVFDDVAERIRSLGGRAPGSMREFAKLTRLSEKSGEIAHAPDMVAALLGDHEALIRSLRADIDKIEPLGDAGTEDFLTALLEQHEKMAWMLRSYLQ
jgi:starvation-inducible DNA-binding protein